MFSARCHGRVSCNCLASWHSWPHPGDMVLILIAFGRPWQVSLVSLEWFEDFEGYEADCKDCKVVAQSHLGLTLCWLVGYNGYNRSCCWIRLCKTSALLYTPSLAGVDDGQCARGFVIAIGSSLWTVARVQLASFPASGDKSFTFSSFQEPVMMVWCDSRKVESRTRYPTLLRSLFRTGDNINPSFWTSKEDSKVSGQICMLYQCILQYYIS